MTRPGDDRADAEHDAWLRAALRHAPDAELGAPPALSAAILRKAGAARPAAGPASAWQQWLDVWSWLARPPVAAGFASVMVATVVGLMWWDRPPDEALPQMADARVMAPVGAAAASASDAALAVTPPPVPAADTAPPSEKAEGAPKPQARPPAVVALRRESRARAAESAAPAQASRSAQSERAEQPQATAAAEPEAARKMAAPAPLADAAAAPPPAQEAVRPAQRAALPAAPAGPAAGARLARPAASPALSSFADKRADMLAQPQRWTWKLGPGTGTAQAMTPALQAWLARVDALLAGGAPQPQVAPAGNTTELQLLLDGRLHSRLSLGDTGLWLLPAVAGRAPLSVALSPETAAALKLALDEALR